MRLKSGLLIGLRSPGPGSIPVGHFYRAVGEMVTGTLLTMGGFGVGLFGGLLFATGLGAAIGVPAVVVSAALVTGGVGNIAAGLSGLGQALSMSSGSGAARDLHGEAVAARDKLAAEVAGQKHPPATVVGGYSESTGQVTRTGETVPVCPNCESTYGRGAFPPNATFKSDQAPK